MLSEHFISSEDVCKEKKLLGRDHRSLGHLVQSIANMGALSKVKTAKEGHVGQRRLLQMSFECYSGNQFVSAL